MGQGYCDFNPKLFAPFISKKVKINPELADDWEIIPTTYVSTTGFSLKSKKLNQEVADIELYRFLKFSKEQKLVIEGLKLKGTYIIGNDRSVYTQSMYNEWFSLYHKRTETIINPKDYIVGNKYTTPCGMSLIYLGYRYVATIKKAHLINYAEHSTIIKKHFYVDASFNKYHDNNSAPIYELKMKLSKDLGVAITKEDADTLLYNLYVSNLNFICFEKVKPTNPVFGIIPMKDYKFSAGYSDKTTKYFNVLIAKLNNQYFSGRYTLYMYTKDTVENAVLGSGTLYLVDPITLIGRDNCTCPSHKKFDSYHRIGLIK
jgi:hypothetical protein